jgi:hypothetical protein
MKRILNDIAVGPCGHTTPQHSSLLATEEMVQLIEPNPLLGVGLLHCCLIAAKFPLRDTAELPLNCRNFAMSHDCPVNKIPLR